MNAFLKADTNFLISSSEEIAGPGLLAEGVGFFGLESDDEAVLHHVVDGEALWNDQIANNNLWPKIRNSWSLPWCLQLPEILGCASCKPPAWAAHFQTVVVEFALPSAMWDRSSVVKVQKRYDKKRHTNRFVIHFDAANWIQFTSQWISFICFPLFTLASSELRKTLIFCR